VVWLVVVSSLSFATAASGQTAERTEEEEAAARAERTEEARLLFLAGQSAFDDGRYPDALASFERSYELAEDPQILYNIAVTLDRLRRDGEALEAFQMYLELQPNTPDRRDIEARIEIIEDQIAAREARTETPIDPTSRSSEDESVLGVTGATGTEPADDGYTVLNRWWFWTAIVLVLGAGAVAIGIVASQDPPPTPGDEGVVLEALSW
jgi:tetratricopeptide (TPR) repeat protein